MSKDQNKTITLDVETVDNLKIFCPDNINLRIKLNTTFCDYCKNYNRANCPCGRFDKNKTEIREVLLGLHECCEFNFCPDKN